MNQRSKLHQIWDIGSLLALATTVAAIIWQNGHEHSWKDNFTQQMNMRFNFMEQQISEVKNTQKENADKIDKIYEIVTTRNNNGRI